MRKKYGHFHSYEWLGIFWMPSKELEFPGKLIYTPEDGVTLEFMCPTGHDVANSDCLYGALSSGETCTLFGNFNLSNYGFHFGEISIYKGTAKFNAVLFGVHSLVDEKFSGLALDLTNFQEFCHPQGLKGYAKYSDVPLFEGKANGLSICIANTGRFSYLESEIENLFYCRNEEVVKELSEAIDGVLQKNKDVEVFQRKDIGWELVLKSSENIQYSEINKNIGKLEGLFSLLIFSPVRRSEVTVLKALADNEKFDRLPLLTSLFDMSKHKIEVLHRYISNFHQAITPNTVNNFSEIISNWFENYDGFKSFSLQVGNRFGKYEQVQLRSSLILYLTQLEAVSKSHGRNKDREKYDFALTLYDKTYIRDVLKSVLQLDSAEGIGKRLSELRGEIAHVGRPENLLSKFSGQELLKICRCLELIIASYIYEKLGVPELNIKEFQKKECPI